jgi:plastocyanin
MQTERFTRPFLPLTMAFALAALTGLTPAFAKDVKVTISNFAFAPVTTTILPGDTVTFVNGDDTIHSVVADDGSFHSNGLDTNDKTTFTFAKVGTIGYHCGLHPFMKGMIVVK